MTRREVTEADVDTAVARAFGRGDATPMAPADAAMEMALARAFVRKPNARAVEAAKRSTAVQEAERDLAPWREAFGWERREDLLGVEETLAELMSSRQGRTMDAARSNVATQLREAWVKGGPSDRDRLVAVAKELTESIARLQAMAPIAGRQVGEAASRPVRIVVSEVGR